MVIELDKEPEGLEFFTESNSLILTKNADDQLVIELSDNYNTFKVNFDKEDKPALSKFLKRAAEAIR